VAKPRSGGDLARLLMEKAARTKRFSSACSTTRTYRTTASAFTLSRPSRRG
jgi:hypothetical protein